MARDGTVRLPVQGKRNPWFLQERPRPEIPMDQVYEIPSHPRPRAPWAKSTIGDITLSEMTCLEPPLKNLRCDGNCGTIHNIYYIIYIHGASLDISGCIWNAAIKKSVWVFFFVLNKWLTPPLDWEGGGVRIRQGQVICIVRLTLWLPLFCWKKKGFGLKRGWFVA